jgi:hypothetical protein
VLPLLIYAIGVLIGLAVMRDPWRSRLATALMWPLGPIAFVVVVTMMLTAAAIVWPLPVLGMAALLGALVWFVT